MYRKDKEFGRNGRRPLDFKGVLGKTVSFFVRGWMAFAILTCGTHVRDRTAMTVISRIKLKNIAPAAAAPAMIIIFFFPSSEDPLDF